MMNGFDRADEIACEHVRWVLSQGMSYRDILRSLGLERDCAGPDDAKEAVAEAWLGLHPFIRPPSREQLMRGRAIA